MLKVLERGGMAIVTSGLNFKDLKKVGPVAIVDDEKEVLVATAAVGAKGSGSATGVGITFDYADKDGNACVNLPVPGAAETADGKKEAIAEKYGEAFAAYNANEAALKAQIKAKKDAHAAIIAGIEIG